MRTHCYILALFMVCGAARAESPLLEEEYLDCLIEPNQSIELGSPVPGLIDRMFVDRADNVEVGQPLVRLESSVEEASSRQAKERAGMDGTVKARRADMQLAKQNMRRMEKLFSRNMVSSQQRDEARAELEVARRNYQVAQENQRLAQLEFETSRAKLSRRIIRSPIDGVVVSRLSMPGEFVDERPVLSLAQLDPLRVEVLMPAERFGTIQPGMRAEVHPEIGLHKLLTANVTTVDRIIDAASGTFRVRLALPNPEQKIPGGLKCGVRFLQQAFVAEDDASSSEAALAEPTETVPEVMQEQPVVSMADQAGDTPMPPTLAPRWCATMEGLESRQTAENVCDHLEAAGVETQLRPYPQQTIVGFGVQRYAPSSQRAKLLTNLKSAGFHDVAAIRSDTPGTVIISAGYFSKRDFAEQRLASLADKGFELSIQARTEEKTLYKLSLRASSKEQVQNLLDELPLQEQPQISELTSCMDALASQPAASVQPN